MDQYSAKSKSYSQELGKINKKYNTISLLRLCVSFFWDLFIITSKIVELSYDFCFFIFYLIVLMRIHSKLLLKERLTRLKEINENEILI
jgi:hypothetical protein